MLPSLSIHLIAIGGTGMAPLACLLKEAGHRVIGSDGVLYPPMSTLLADAGIETLVGYEAGHLEPRPDLVVVGNAVPRDNPEARETERLGIERVSMPEALAHFFLEGRRPLVIAGTHGKTTTTSIAAWVYTECGADPGFLVGGVPLGLARSFHRGSGERFVVEGDEYNAAYFDRGPKFLHYRPHTLVLTSTEYDHADLYPDHETLLTAYRSVVEILPHDGLLIACGDDGEVRRIAAKAPCRVVFYGIDSSNDAHPEGAISTDAEGSRFTLVDSNGEEVQIRLRLSGEHNVANSLAIWCAARADGLAGEDVAAALARFQGVKRRTEVLGTAGGITVIDDFAHHPTAVEKTLEGLRARYEGRRLVAAFEPRSLSAARARFAADYRRALAVADVVYIAPVFHAARLAESERLNLEDLVADLAADGVPAVAAPSIAELLERANNEARSGDVFISMSSGSFEGLPHRYLERLEQG